MEELEDPTEKLKELQEEMLEKDHEIKEERVQENWMRKVALTTAIIAVLAAIAGLFGNHLSNEALMDQLKASDQWAFFQAKGIKAEVEASTVTLLQAMGKEQLAEEAEQKNSNYEKEKQEIKKVAEEAQKSSESNLRKHLVFSWAVTIFQIAIAISATAIITRRKQLWYLCILLAGIGFLLSLGGFFVS